MRLKSSGNGAKRCAGKGRCVTWDRRGGYAEEEADVVVGGSGAGAGAVGGGGGDDGGDDQQPPPPPRRREGPEQHLQQHRHPQQRQGLRAAAQLHRGGGLRADRADRQGQRVRLREPELPAAARDHLLPHPLPRQGPQEPGHPLPQPDHHPGQHALPGLRPRRLRDAGPAGAGALEPHGHPSRLGARREELPALLLQHGRLGAPHQRRALHREQQGREFVPRQRRLRGARLRQGHVLGQPLQAPAGTRRLPRALPRRLQWPQGRPVLRLQRHSEVNGMFVFLYAQCLSMAPENRVKSSQCRYSYLGRRCVNASECQSMQTSHSIDVQPYGEFSLTNWWPFNRTCVHQCPPDYQKLETANGTLCQSCHGPCSIECRGGVVSSIADAQLLRGCTTITSLEIFIRGSGSHIVRELEENLAAIEEIQGYLKVSRSFPLTSLNFLKNLRVIHGNELEDKRYSLLVFENQNLQELWNWTNRPPLKIKNGALKFHYNPKLCLSEIDKLQEIAGLQNYSNFDVSRESNGDKVACNVVTLSANATVLSSKTVLIEWEPCKVPDPTSVLGYMVYYIEAPERNVTEHDGLDACGDNGWRVVDFPYDTDNTSHASPCTNLIQFLPHLEPFTQYAYYVKTYTKTNTGGQSNIKYFRTRPDRPSVPKEIRAVSNSSSDIILQWLPPEYPNGILSHYLISGKWMKDDQRYLDQRNYCKFPLEHIPNPDVQITPSSTSESVAAHACCEVGESEPLVLIEDAEDYQKLCVSGPARKLGEDVDPCDSYFYSFIHTGIPELLHTKPDGLGDRFPDHLPAASAPGEEMPFNTTVINVDGVFEQFLEKIDANTTYKVLRNLQHFAEYTINVFACREPHSTEPQHLMKNIDYQSFCSPAAIVSIRTKPLATADKIEYAHLAVDISNTSRSVKLTWKEPRKPNGIVVSYSIEHKRIDIENFQPVLDCISRKEYVDFGGGFVLSNLSPGNYTFRVKATSLAGEGQFTEQFSFHMEELPVESAAGVLTGVLLTAMLVLLVLAVASFLWWRKRVKERIMIIADAHIDQQPRPQDSSHDDLTTTTTTPVPFYQLLEEDGGAAHVNDSDSYVLPGNHRRQQAAAAAAAATVPSHVLPGPSETESLLPRGAEDGYVPAESVYVHPESVYVPAENVRRVSFAEPEAAYVPTESVHPQSDEDRTSPQGADNVGRPSSSAERDKDRRYRPPNGVVNGYISVPQNQDDSEFVPRFQ
ncbi:hypothetical protein C0J52_13639 [Blattella germanica]|nr:hypothetical protein C0J52_13639 [Blattella germanica]